MKTALDPRHKKRITTMQQLFAAGFNQTRPAGNAGKILEKVDKLDEKIQLAAPEWPIDKIAKIDLAILRLASFELTIDKSQPPKVIIDEAIELAKEFGNQNSPKFVNGVLGTILKTISENSENSEAQKIR